MTVVNGISPNHSDVGKPIAPLPSTDDVTDHRITVTSRDNHLDTPPWWRSERMALFTMSAMSVFMLSVLRVNLSMTLICMISPNQQQGKQQFSNGTSSGIDENPFQWSRQIQGNILSSLYFGYIVTQIPSGYLSNKYGAKVVLTVSLLVSSLVTVLMNWTPYLSVTWFLWSRVVLGLSLGFIIPANVSLWGKWAPVSERSMFIVYALSGTGTGVVFSMFTAGFLCGLSTGWPLVNYVYGTMGIVTALVCAYFCYDSPGDHPTISAGEKAYIQDGKPTISSNKCSTPWLSILRSGPCWAVVVAHTCANWGFYTMMMGIPLFIKDVFHSNLKDNGVLSALPFVALTLVASGASPIADLLRRRDILSTKNTRKLFQIACYKEYFKCQLLTKYQDLLQHEVLGALLICSLCLVGIPYTGRVTSIVLLSLGTGALGLSFCGYACNAVDIAPRYSGIIISISNTVATLPGMISPVVVGLLTQQGTRTEWRNVFFISAVIFVFGSVVYAFFADGVEQSWAKHESEDIKPTEVIFTIENNNKEKL